MSASSPSKRSRGFTMIETMVAITVLSIGLISVAALAATMLTTGKRSKYMSLASTLASEKLEDLSRYAPSAPQICLPTGSTSVGNITADAPIQTVTCPNSDTNSLSVAYDDDVDISFGTGGGDCPNEGGCFAETIASISNGTTQYSTTYHSPDGVVKTSTSTTSSSQALAFHRQWLIEGDTPVAGVRRITVLVTLKNNVVNPPVRFQMSAVHP